MNYIVLIWKTFVVKVTVSISSTPIVRRFRAVSCKLLSSAIQLWEQQLTELFVAVLSLN